MVFAWTETAALANKTKSDAHEDEEIEEIIVSAHPLADDGTAHDATVIGTEEINRSIQSSIGAVVKKETGIHSTSYGEAVGRPIIHGLGGTRVRVMEDQTETMDASVLGVDHAVTTEAIIAERIEILKGPSTLLYGSGAIGGVVDVHTHRIPSRIPNQLSGKGELRRADNGGRTFGAMVVEGAVRNLHGILTCLGATPMNTRYQFLPNHPDSSSWKKNTKRKVVCTTRMKMGMNTTVSMRIGEL